MQEPVKAVFLDYFGTVISLKGEDAAIFMRRILQNSDIPDAWAFMSYWWGLVKEYEEATQGENYMTEDKIIRAMLTRCAEEKHLREDLDELFTLCLHSWIHAPFFADVKPFFEQCPCPIYIISNNSVACISEALRINGLSVAGIVSADAVRYHKPAPEIFRKAIEVSARTPSEILHIGDSYGSDVQGARRVGIRPVLLDRSGAGAHPDVPTVSALTDAIPMILG